ncbi:hypothetical protein IC619_016570 [Hazenella sp. IB182353]|uniref:hypothetical protein n=1 Tax=Polycladospora coralii TaxID=2771432 RepID=UPI00174723D8|nr:hypothetical protein [Polycladospora coralii]MBS7532048.1 hypothetical protein [Polycladospora coralii]
MNLSIFEELPDYMSKEKLEMYFNQVIDYYKSTDNVNIMKLSEVIYELSDRQWRTYTCLDEEIRQKMDLIIKEIIDPYSYELMDTLLSIIALLGLKESYQKLKEVDMTTISADVKKMIEEMFDELDGSISNPYSGLE